MPAGYLDRPDIREGLDFIWDAFWSLSSDRQVGMGEGGIPFTAIDRYAQRYGMDRLDDFDRFQSLIRGLDGEYLTIRGEQSKRDLEVSKKDKPV